MRNARSSVIAGRLERRSIQPQVSMYRLRSGARARDRRKSAKKTMQKAVSA